MRGLSRGLPATPTSPTGPASVILPAGPLDEGGWEGGGEGCSTHLPHGSFASCAAILSSAPDADETVPSRWCTTAAAFLRLRAGAASSSSEEEESLSEESAP